MPNTSSILQGIGFAPNLTIHPGHWLKITRPDGSVVRVRIIDPNHDPANNGTNTGTVNNPANTLTTGYSDTFTIGLVDAHGLTKQSLNWGNCYSFGNGVESNRVTDTFNAPQVTPGVRVSTTFEDYKQEHRKYGLIYSGLYNSISSVNNLNQFIQAEKITKDINPTYGSIQKLHTRDTDLITLCEDKVLKILANKDAVYNADGNPQLTANERVLGQTVPFVGEFGISKNPESFVSEAYRSYFTDKQRGAVMRLSKDGLTPISMHGMKDWFRDNLKLSNKLVGSYDDRNDEYNITLNATVDEPTMGQTVSFREDVKGWVSFKSFVPENAISCANDYFTIKNGKLYKHYDESKPRNTFYNIYVDSSVNVMLNDKPGSVKSYHTLDYEGSQSRVEGIKTIEVTGIEYAGSQNNGRYFFFEESEVNSLFNQPDSATWSAVGPGVDPGNPEKAVVMKQYRNNILIHSGLMMFWNNIEPTATSSPSGGSTKGFGRRTEPDGNWGDASNLGDFEVGDIITTEEQEKTVNHFNSMPKDGWYVSDIGTDKQVGSLPEFIEKEGKWFNYIKGANSDVDENTDFGAFNIQGIGIVNNVNGYDLTFSNNINSSLQIGDTIYSEEIPSEQVFGFSKIESNQLQKCGVVTGLTQNIITLDNSGILPTAQNYIMFAKNHVVNTSSLLGYYADVKFENNSKEKAELFSVNSEITESSK